MSTRHPNPNKLKVLTVGFGKAGSQLHLPSWIDQGADIIAYDTDRARLDPANFAPEAKAAYADGRLVVIHTLSELTDVPDVVDIVTASGHHVEAIEQVLAAIAKIGGTPKAWLIEKPVVSDSEEAKRLLAVMNTYHLDENSLFVDENYLVSRGVENLRKVIAKEVGRGNDLCGIDVVFYKNRVPDVLKKRFTDPVLGAFGIELPHMLAIAYSLAEIKVGDEVQVERNDYHTDVHGIAHSEATYTVLKTDETKIRLAQGLGPFTMDASGKMQAVDDPGISRYAIARFADGRTAKVLFDPVPGIERFHSVVAWKDENGRSSQQIVPDNSIQHVIELVASCTRGVEREADSDGLSVSNAIHYATTLLNLRRTAVRK